MNEVIYKPWQAGQHAKESGKTEPQKRQTSRLRRTTYLIRVISKAGDGATRDGDRLISATLRPLWRNLHANSAAAIITVKSIGHSRGFNEMRLTGR